MSSKIKGKKNVRTDVLANSISAAVQSKLCLFLALGITCTAVAVIGNYLVVLLLPLAFAVVFFKALVFEALVVDHSLEASLGYFDWYTCVDDNLYLGAIPLEHQDIERLADKLGIKAIVSIVQKFEMETATLAGRPVRPQQWTDRGVAQIILDSPDFSPPSFENLDAGAAFLNVHLSQGRKCYCHCKSGKGRSASIILAYFMKYRNEDVHTAYAKLKLKRPFVFGPASSQLKNMIAYGEYLRKPAAKAF